MVELTNSQKNGIQAAIQKSRKYSISADPRTDFQNHLEQEGYKPDSVIILDQVIRISDPTDKGSKKTGWYWYSEFEMTGYVLGVGVYGTWRDGEKLTWSSKSQSLMTFDESANYRHKIEQSRIAREEEQERVYNDAAKRALYEYDQSALCDIHPYLELKHISTVYGLRINKDGSLIVPITNEKDELTSIQKIFPDGFKKNFTGGKMKGSFFLIDGLNNLICICEGVATGISIYEATGATVYCAMSANNIYETTGIAKRKYPNSEIVICADDNSANKINTGLNAATQSAEAFSCRVVSPTTPKDFNDMACAEGLDSVKSLIIQNKKKYNKKKSVKKDGIIIPEDGFLRDVYDYYNATSGNVQKGFAIQTSIALASVILGRRYQTDNGNFSSLFLLNIGKSATGKEHSKTVVFKILKEAGFLDLMGGSGYTSEGAVVSTTLNKPKHLAICDEFGRNLMAAKNSGDANFAGANTKLMEAIGACHSIMRPRNYSTMGIARDKAEDLGRSIENPAITILAMSTPSTFFESIDHKSIEDGFIGRFIISVSDAKRSIRKRVADINVPESIKSWILQAMTRSKSIDNPDVATDTPHIEMLQISNDAWEEYEKTAQYFIDQANELEEMRMDDFNNRAHEFVLRLGLICALSENINSELVEKHHIEWASNYIKSCTNRVLSEFKHHISGSEFEAKKKEALTALRNAGQKGISLSDMNKKQPFAKWPPKDRREILGALEEAELAFKDAVNTNGRNATVYFAAGD